MNPDPSKPGNASERVRMLVELLLLRRRMLRDLEQSLSLELSDASRIPVRLFRKSRYVPNRLATRTVAPE